MTTLKFVLLIILALATVPAGNWIGGMLEQQRVESAFKELREQEAKDTAYLAGFQAAQEAERDRFNRLNEARVQAALKANAELAAELGL